MKKLLFVPSLFALMLWALGCEQMSFPGFKKGSHHYQFRSDAHYFVNHYGPYGGVRFFSWEGPSTGDKTIYDRFEKGICVLARHTESEDGPQTPTPDTPKSHSTDTVAKPIPEDSSSKDSSENVSSRMVFTNNANAGIKTVCYRKFIYGKFESGELKEAYITRKAYLVDQSNKENNLVYIKYKADKKAFIDNVLVPYLLAAEYKELDPSNDYLIQVLANQLNGPANATYDGLLIGTVSSPSKERGFRNWVSSKKISLSELN